MRLRSALAARSPLSIAQTPGAAERRRLSTGWRRQLALFGAAYVVYNLARWVFAGDLAPAREHARWIVDLERDAGVAIEGSVQRGLDSGVASWLLSNVYLAAQFVVVPGALIWFYRRRPQVYRSLRNTLLATWLIAVPIFALYPVAPPRLADMGIADTVSQQAGVELTGRSTIFYNQLAAVPSLHVGFAVAVGVAFAVALRRRWAKVLALLWGPLVSLSVVATGNHYLFDIAAGLVVTAAGFAAWRLLLHLPRAVRTPIPGSATA
jgi:membrane-associated phospholipid phosphatase